MAYLCCTWQTIVTTQVSTFFPILINPQEHHHHQHHHHHHHHRHHHHHHRHNRFKMIITHQAALVPVAPLLPSRHCQLLPQHPLLQLPLQGDPHQVIHHSCQLSFFPCQTSAMESIIKHPWTLINKAYWHAFHSKALWFGGDLKSSSSSSPSYQSQSSSSSSSSISSLSSSSPYLSFKSSRWPGLLSEA